VPFAREFFTFNAPARLVWESLAVGIVGAALVEVIHRLTGHHRGGRRTGSAPVE
jgi:cation-transporting ATPase E